MTIGIDVFELPTDFDPKRDPVVRMAMRRFGSGCRDITRMRVPRIRS
jgi:hypothetical protein